MASNVHTWGVSEEDQWVRQRVQSMDTSVFFRKVDQPWRPRVFSVPANTVSVKYGRRRRFTDEFDILLEKGMTVTAEKHHSHRYSASSGAIKSLTQTQRGDTKGKLKLPPTLQTMHLLQSLSDFKMFIRKLYMH